MLEITINKLEKDAGKYAINLRKKEELKNCQGRLKELLKKKALFEPLPETIFNQISV